MQRVAKVGALILVALAAVPGAVVADQRDEEAVRPSIAISYARRTTADFEDLEPGSTSSARELQAFLSLARFGSGHRYVDVGLDYQYTHYDYEIVPSRDRDLHRLQLPLQFAVEAGHWRLDGYVAPSISTSSNIFKDFLNRGSSDDAWVAGRIEAARQVNSRAWLFGAAYDRRFGEARLYPIVGIRSAFGENVSMRLAFPASVVEWRVSDRQAITGRLFPAGHEWRVVTDDFAASFRYRVEAWRTQLAWTYRPWRYLALDLSVGREFDGRHEFVDDAGVRLRSDTADQWIGALGIRVGGGDQPLAHGAHL